MNIPNRMTSPLLRILLFVILPHMQTTVNHTPFEGRIRITKYSSEEIIKNFLSIYAALDFRSEIADMNIGFLQFAKNRVAIQEMHALSIALWEIALEKSFPEDCADFFTDFLEKAEFLQSTSKEGARLRNRLGIYRDLLYKGKDSNFFPVAQYLVEILAIKDKDIPSIRLKLSLNIRTLYHFIFERLC